MKASIRNRAAIILAEAAVFGDEEAIKRHKISLRTLQRYRKAVGSDPELARLFADKKAALEVAWAQEIPAAAREAILFLRRASEKADPKDPAVIHAVAGALKILTETHVTLRGLDAFLSAVGATAEGAQTVRAPADEENGGPRAYA